MLVRVPCGIQTGSHCPQRVKYERAHIRISIAFTCVSVGQFRFAHDLPATFVYPAGVTYDIKCGTHTRNFVHLYDINSAVTARLDCSLKFSAVTIKR